jgi:predicted transglutaminase-like cysteine proteinase
MKNKNKKKITYTLLARVTSKKRDKLTQIASVVNDTVSNLIRQELYGMLERNNITTQDDILKEI